MWQFIWHYIKVFLFFVDLVALPVTMFCYYGQSAASMVKGNWFWGGVWFCYATANVLLFMQMRSTPGAPIH